MPLCLPTTTLSCKSYFSLNFPRFAIRWSRLLLGREFIFSDTHVLRVWDFLFCSSTVKESEPNYEQDSNSAVSVAGSSSTEMDGSRSANNSKNRYDAHQDPCYCPVLTTLRDFMLAMLIYVSTVSTSLSVTPLPYLTSLNFLT